MKTQAYLPVGGVITKETKLVKKGDVLELATGEKVVFTEMKQVKFHAIDKITGNVTVVPIYRNKNEGLPFIKAIVGRDESVFTKSASYSNFKHGQLFAIEGHKEAFMFVDNTLKRGKVKIIAMDLATSRRITITPSGFTFVKINVPKIKRENKPA